MSEQQDIVGELRGCSAYFFSAKADRIMEDAAKEIESLRKQRDELVFALKEAIDWEGHIDASRDAHWIAIAKAAVEKVEGIQ